MNSARRATLSLAAFVLLCFFLPWVQLSCGGTKDSVSGFDLAHSGDKLLWLVPSFMLVIILLGLSRFIWEKVPVIFALASTVGGSLSAYLILVPAQWTALFWLGFVACLGIVAAALMFYARRSRSP
jgi:hypothetical protein